MVEKLKYIVNILIVALLLTSVAIRRDGRVAGVDVATIIENSGEESEEEIPIETTLDNGERLINSTSLAKDIVGFGGRTPVVVYVNDGVIQKVEVEPNNETPSFFDQVAESGLLESWNGVSLSEAATKTVDVVSGATYTSAALIGNVRRAAQWGADVAPVSESPLKGIGLKAIVGLLVILLGVFVSLRRAQSKLWVTLQLVLNVVVLGFWCGSFLSLATLTSWISSGVNLSLGIVSLALLCVVIAVPLFGRKGTYCQLHCPMGSAQELLGRVPLTKVKISPAVAKVLGSLRYYILSAMLLMMWPGVGFSLMDYEIFSAFIFSSASSVVLVLASVFLTLSLFIHRPYCRFVCPTGALITMSQLKPRD